LSPWSVNAIDCQPVLVDVYLRAAWHADETGGRLRLPDLHSKPVMPVAVRRRPDAAIACSRPLAPDDEGDREKNKRSSNEHTARPPHFLTLLARSIVFPGLRSLEPFFSLGGHPYLG